MFPTSSLMNDWKSSYSASWCLQFVQRWSSRYLTRFGSSNDSSSLWNSIVTISLSTQTERVASIAWMRPSVRQKIYLALKLSKLNPFDVTRTLGSIASLRTSTKHTEWGFITGYITPNSWSKLSKLIFFRCQWGVAYALPCWCNVRSICQETRHLHGHWTFGVHHVFCSLLHDKPFRDFPLEIGDYRLSLYRIISKWRARAIFPRSDLRSYWSEHIGVHRTLFVLSVRRQKHAYMLLIRFKIFWLLKF